MLPFPIIEILPPCSDQLYLRLQPHTEALFDYSLGVSDEPSHVRRGGATRVHEVVRVHGRHLRAADPVPLEPRRLDQLPGSTRTALFLPARARRILEDAAAARLIERRAPLAPLEHLGDLFFQPMPLLGPKPDRGLHHHPARQTAAAIAERDLGP